MTASAPDNPSITNVQVAGVDEGGIVKVAGQHLVILRRGRLFTVSTANDGLRPIDSIDAYPPGVDPSDDWYDEMLISGDLIVVVGYSYERGGTEINRFRLSLDGRLSFVDSHHLKSDDYYSSRNFASRLIGNQLIIYSPLYFGYDDDPLHALPGLSRWSPGQDGPRYQRITSARQVYIPAPLRAAGPGSVESMHTVNRCDLTAAELDCTATVVLGPSGRTFFVSTNAVYVWVSPAWSWQEEGQLSFLYRIPLDGGRPAAVQVQGGPIDQFSFHANVPASRLDILVADMTGGDAMWGPEYAEGQPALLQLPTSRFGDGSRAAPASDYRLLPGGDYISVLHNRFIGDWLLYALRPQIASDNRAQLIAAPLAGGSPVVFDMAGGVDRIEQLGGDALAVGEDLEGGGVVFTTVDLTSGRLPLLGDRFADPAAREAESRSHAFFYRADSPDGADGLLGLPVLRTVEADDRYGQARTLAEMLFVRRAARQLSDFGRLSASDVDRSDDGCQASCVDWYGNARPIFLGDRIFALLGYELVEGAESGGGVREVGRTDFSPAGEEPKAR